jgi:2-aminoethylphosphonate dioxygenase
MPAFVPSQAQVEQFRKDGFLLLRLEEHRLVDPEQLKAWSEQVHDWPTENGKWMPYYEVNTDGTQQLMRTENFVDFHDGFEELLCGNALATILKALSGDVSGTKHRRR